MDSEDGELFVKQLATFVRSHEKALANALQFQRRDVRHRPTQSTSAAAKPVPSSLPDRPSTSGGGSSSLAAALSLGALNFTSNNVKSARLALTPHHLFYLLSRFEEIGIIVGPMGIRLENLHDSSTSANYVSFLGNTGRSQSMSSDVGSIHSVSSVRSVMSGMSAFWASFGIGASITAARNERQKAAVQADLKYLYSAFTKIPSLRLAPDSRARLIKGYEEFPFDSAVPIYIFKNLQALEVSGIDFRQFFGWDRLADQLRSLTLRRAGVEDPADILIDIVMDDMDKRRRRTSKSRNSPSTTWTNGGSPRRSPTILQTELNQGGSVPAIPNPIGTMSELRIGSLSSSEHALEDGSLPDRTSSYFAREDSEVASKSPSRDDRPRSKSPSRPASSRHHSSYVRSSHRITRSGSGSSHSSFSDSWYHHVRGSSGNLMAMAVFPSSKWRFLRHLSLAENSMTSINPTSLAPLANTLFSLDLSTNLFSQVPDSLATLTALRALNLSHCMIDSLQSLKRNPLPAITALNLRGNRLQSLAGVEKLYPLERLDLRDNRITDPIEIARLTGIPDIREIWVEGNPLTRTHRNYRIVIFNLFRNTPGYTEDILIDGASPSYSERRLLIARAPMPATVPVVKPAVPEEPAVEVNKPPTIIHTSSMAAIELQTEKSNPKAVRTEISRTTSRKRRTPKRRIVDLASSATPPSSMATLGRSMEYQSKISDAQSETNTPDGVSLKLETPLLPPVELSKSNFGEAAVTPSPSQPSPNGPARLPVVVDNVESRNWKEPQNWNDDAGVFRRNLQALSSHVASDYLSSTEEPWGGNSPAVVGIGLHNAHNTFRPPPAQAT